MGDDEAVFGMSGITDENLKSDYDKGEKVKENIFGGPLPGGKKNKKNKKDAPVFEQGISVAGTDKEAQKRAAMATAQFQKNIQDDQIRKVRDTIVRYYNAFPGEITMRPFKNNWKVEDYRDELTRIKAELRSKRALTNAKRMVMFLCNVAEKTTAYIWNPMGWDLNNFGRIVQDNWEELEMDVKELTVEYPGLFMTPAIVNIVLTLIGLAQLTDNVNKGLGSSGSNTVPQQPQTVQVAPEVAARYSDL